MEPDPFDMQEMDQRQFRMGGVTMDEVGVTTGIYYRHIDHDLERDMLPPDRRWSYKNFTDGFSAARCIIMVFLVQHNLPTDPVRQVQEQYNRYPKPMRDRRLCVVVNITPTVSFREFTPNDLTRDLDLHVLGIVSAFPLKHGGFCIFDSTLCDYRADTSWGSPSVGSFYMRLHTVGKGAARRRLHARAESNATLTKDRAVRRLRDLWIATIPLDRGVWEEAIPDVVNEPFLLSLSPHATLEHTIDFLPASIALAHAEKTPAVEVRRVFYDICERYFVQSLGRSPAALLPSSQGSSAGLLVLMRYLSSADRPLVILSVDASLYGGIMFMRNQWLKDTKMPHKVIMHTSELDPTERVDVVMCDASPLYTPMFSSPRAYTGGLLPVLLPQHLSPDAVFFLDFTCFPLHPGSYLVGLHDTFLRQANVVMYASMHKLHMLGSDRVSMGLTAVFHHNNNLVVDCARQLVDEQHPNEDMDLYSLSYVTFCMRDPFAVTYVQAYQDNVRSMYEKMQSRVPLLCPEGLQGILDARIPLPYVMVVFRDLFTQLMADPKNLRLWGSVNLPEQQRWEDVLRKHIAACTVLKTRASFGFRTPAYDHAATFFRISPGMHPHDVDVMVQMLSDAMEEFQRGSSP